MATQLKCYISAPASFDLSKIELILDQIHIAHHSFYDFSIGTTFSDLIRRKIRESDFVIAILEENNPNIVYELGVAEGLRKPVFVLVDRELKTPYFLSGQPFFKTTFDDLTLIKLAISNFTQDLGLKTKKVKIGTEGDTLSIDDTNEFLMRIQQLRRDTNEHAMVNLIEQIFAKINVRYESLYNSPRENGADLVIMSDQLMPYFGYPLFVEVKSGKLTHESIRLAERQLNYAITNTDAHGGLILYLDRAGRRFDQIQLQYNVLSFDLEDFVDGIASNGFERLLIDKRNKRAHGQF